jgi:glyoxylase-like metal-dependent hydrolase (beta-lactamase superfamily II)
MRIAEGVYSIGQSKGGHVHAYLFEHGDELTLVDTLFDADAALVVEAIGRIGRSPGDLKHIALTHAHRSHLGGLAQLKRLSGALVHAHEWEADIIAGERLAQPVSMRPSGPLATYPMRIGLALGRPKHPPCPVDRGLAEGDQVGPLRVLHIPGHTPGFNLNERQYRESLKRLARVEAEVVAVGHGEPLTEDAAERVHALAEA